MQSRGPIVKRLVEARLGLPSEPAATPPVLVLGGWDQLPALAGRPAYKGKGLVIRDDGTYVSLGDLPQTRNLKAVLFGLLVREYTRQGIDRLAGNVLASRIEKLRTTRGATAADVERYRAFDAVLADAVERGIVQLYHPGTVVPAMRGYNSLYVLQASTLLRTDFSAYVEYLKRPEGYLLALSAKSAPVTSAAPPMPAPTPSK